MISVKEGAEAWNTIMHYNQTGELLNTNIDLHDTEKQLILFTKGHFGSIDYIDGLKYFAAELYGLYPEQVEPRSELHLVTTLYQKLVDAGYIRFELSDFISKLFRRSSLYSNKAEIDHYTILWEMLSQIQNTKVAGLNLGEPDKTILTKWKDGETT